MEKYNLEFTVTVTKKHKATILALDKVDANMKLHKYAAADIHYSTDEGETYEGIGGTLTFSDISVNLELIDKVEAMNIVIENLDPCGPLYETLLAIKKNLLPPKRAIDVIIEKPNPFYQREIK